MSIDENRPVFNLKAVVQETGLKPDTLRAWERRYGLPRPKRSDGGHRLYTARDVAMLKWLAFRQGEGMSISRAVDLWQRLEAQGNDPLVARPYGAVATRPSGSTPIFAGDNTLAGMRAAWLAACLNFDEAQAEQILVQAYALYSPEMVAVELLQKSLIEVGEGWYQGKVTVQQEHFASALATRRLEAILAATPAATRAGRILAVCAPGEEHTFGLLVATLLLRRQGWDVLYLGANVPLERLGTTVATVRPNMILASAHQLQAAATLLDMAHNLSNIDVTVAYGGLIFDKVPPLRRRIPAHFIGGHLARVPAMVEQLLSAPPAVPDSEAPPAGYEAAYAHFQERRWLLEADVQKNMKEVPGNVIVMAQSSLATNIDAALRLGNIEWVTPEIQWLKGLLKHHDVPGATLQAFLRAYYSAVTTLLDERSQPISDWLGRLLRATANGENER